MLDRGGRTLAQVFAAEADALVTIRQHTAKVDADESPAGSGRDAPMTCPLSPASICCRRVMETGSTENRLLVAAATSCCDLAKNTGCRSGALTFH
jgi:hypothetical protein